MEMLSKEEVRELMSDIIATHAARMEGQFAVVNLKLEKIQEQTTKTNGRVTALETQPHPIANCPHGKLIDDLKTDMISSAAERKYSRRVSAFVATVIATIISLLALVV